MRTVLPGKPQPKLQAVSTAQWEGRRLIVPGFQLLVTLLPLLILSSQVYISGNALVILGGPHHLIQTVYQEESEVLDAVSIDEASGKIAISSLDEVHVYKPYGMLEGGLKWSLESSIQISTQLQRAATLSWGSDAELLLGGTSLKLYQTNAENELIWDRKLSGPAKFAEFSHDASLVASTGLYDRLD